MNARTSSALLENGDVMNREEFHRRFSDCEGLERVELIEGVVYMPAPIRIVHHERPAKLARRWLDAYELLHTGEVEAMDGGTILLDDRNEPMPDAMLYRLREGQFLDGYFNGAPELVLEVAASTVSRDLHQKKRAYERNGVIEYIVWRTGDNAIDWFRLIDGKYQLQVPVDEVIESAEFPGLRLDVAAMLPMDREAVLNAVRKA